MKRKRGIKNIGIVWSGKGKGLVWVVCWIWEMKGECDWVDGRKKIYGFWEIWKMVKGGNG